MAITYPNTLDELSNPASTDPLTGHAAQHANVNDAIEALEIKVGITGSADTDSLDYKAAAATAHIAASAPHAGHATTSGKSGGQTLIGGTAASETLTLRSTAHATKGSIILGTLSVYDEVNERLGIGATAPSARMHAVSQTEQLRLGYDAANYETTTVSSTGVVSMTSTGGQWTYKAGTSSATLGSELITNGGFTSDISGWTDSGSSWSWSAGTALHTAGSASTLTQNISVTNGSTYQIEFTIAGRTAGSISLALGSVSVIESGVATDFTSSSKRTVVAGASGSVALVITPTSDFNGSVDGIALKLVTLGSVTPNLVLLDSAGAISMETRAITAALQTCAIGSYAQRSITTGSGDTALGSSAQYSLTTGSYDTAVGTSAQRSMTTGSSDTAVGYGAQYSLTTGSSDTAVGYTAQHSLTTGSYDTAVGHGAQRYLPDGTTAVQVFNNCTHLGANTRVSAEDASNETAIGYQAIGLGSNTVSIGDLNVTRTGLRGSVEIIASSSTTASQIQGALAASWVDSTHATRKARLVISAYDTAAREAIRVEGSGTAPLIGFYGAAAVAKPTALTTQLPALTYTAPGTPDYAIAAVTQTTPYGFTTADEAHTVLSVIKNLQDRVSQLETKLQALGLLT